MFIRADSVAKDSVLETDICVIGAGAAGIAFSREFLDSSVRICVLESGEIITRQGRVAIETYRFLYRNLDRFLGQKATKLVSKKIVSLFAHDPLYETECAALPVSHTSRRRAFGGSTIAWAGKCKRPDEIDFTVREWVPNSGWPIPRSELDRYYDRAAQDLFLPNVRTDDAPTSVFADQTFEPKYFWAQKKKWRNWGVTFKKAFQESKNISVYFGAHVTRFKTINTDVEAVYVATSTGNTFQVKAKKFVLACGGIENARQLLVSNLGNEHDQVGRYYMDHPKAKIGVIQTKSPVDISSYWDVRTINPHFIGFRLSDAIQKKEHILNSHIFLEPEYSAGFIHKARRKILGKKFTNRIAVRNYLEQVPSSQNRVYLGTAVDSFGIPKVKIDWSLSDLDKKTITVMHKYLAETVKKSGLGEFVSPLLTGDTKVFSKFDDASHHMGTTRMGVDPKNSVVDANCKVHSLTNLYVAGSSVFPTSGHSNPTVTIAALAIRLADHLKGKEKAPVVYAGAESATQTIS